MIARVARHPVVVLLAIAVAVACGAIFRTFSLAIAPLGDFYVGLLKMCVIPMLFSIVALSIMRLMVSENARRHTVAVLWVFPLLLAATAGVATLFGVVTHGGGAPAPAALASLGVAVFSAEKPIEVELNGPPPTPGPSAASQFVQSIVPDNVIAAFANGDALKILIFSVIFGVALGALYGAHYHVLYEFLEEVYHAFYQILDWLLLALPIGLFCIMAPSTARIDMHVFTAIVGFVVTFIALSVVLVALYGAIIARCTRTSMLAVTRALRAPALLAFTTRNSFAATPLAITALETLGLPEEAVQLLVPLAVSFCRFGSAAYFAFAAYFVATLYGVEHSIAGVIVIAGAAILAGIASAGTTGIVSLLPLGLVLQGVGLPFDAVLILFIAVDPVIDPFRTTVMLVGGTTAAATVASMNE